MRIIRESGTPSGEVVWLAEVCRFGPFDPPYYGGNGTSIWRRSETQPEQRPEGNVCFVFAANSPDLVRTSMRQIYRICPRSGVMRVWDMTAAPAGPVTTEAGQLRWWFDLLGVDLDEPSFPGPRDREILRDLSNAVPVPGDCILPAEDLELYAQIGEPSPLLWTFDPFLAWALDRPDAQVLDKRLPR